MKHLGDITKISGYEVPAVDVIIGGSPCQDLSVAGKRAGLAGERSGLFMEQIRIIKEMRENAKRRGAINDVRPRYMVWENVPGAFSSEKGEDFRAVLEEVAKVCDENAVIPRPSDGKWTNAGCIMADGWSIAWRVFNSQFWGVPQRRRRIALVADFGGKSAPEILFVRKGSSRIAEPSEKERKNASSDSGNRSEEYDREVWAGNPGLMIRFGNKLEKGITPTLATSLGDNTMSVVYSVDFGGGKSSCNVTEGNTATLTCTHGGEPVVCYPEVSDGCLGTLDAHYGNGPGERGGIERTVVCQNLIVRRLMPIECERLQGFPDGWTDIGDYVDGKGKLRKTSDASRYKALGNSIALPSWKWVLKRISAQYERDATMASLFDGIGGFPLLWEQINGKGTCLWASEIEDFPIAVTKKRIGE